MRKPTRASLYKEHKAETDAAWDAMSKRWARSTARLQRGLEKLDKDELAIGMKPHREK